MEALLSAIGRNENGQPALHRFFDHCAGDGALREELVRIAHVRGFSSGETIVGEGEESGLVGTVISGVLRVQKTMPDGRQQIVGLLFAPNLFGRVFSRVSPVAIEAATDCRLCCFSRIAFESFLARHPAVEHDVMLAVLDELDAAQEWMLLLGCQAVQEKVASFLLMILRQADAGGRPRRRRRIVDVPISRHDMAVYLGTTTETISRTIQDFARRGVLRVINPQRFEVLDVAGLAFLSGRVAEPGDIDEPSRKSA
ncbi:MAG TPA: Crp/Fnr family transcriptional regulator [Rhizobiales bacterium]|nr:Crp/Fnr family transcriptional regulator [Hyphomicrobiales bacterium]